jgi:hypothetical protein
VTGATGVTSTIASPSIRARADQIGCGMTGGAGAGILHQDAGLCAQKKVRHRATAAKGVCGDAGHGGGGKAGDGVRREQGHRPDPGDGFAAAFGGDSYHPWLHILDSDEPLGGFDQRAAGDGRKRLFKLGQGRGDAGRAVSIQAIMRSAIAVS